MAVESLIAQHLTRLPASCRQIYIGYSGGADSSVLLHALAKSKANLPPVIAIHIHHGLSPYADEWATHCRREAEKLHIPLHVIRVQAKPLPGQSPEAAAREARYQAFAQLINADDVLMLAHHSDDQAETFLLQLLRGAGVRGLAAMPVWATFNSGWLSRPLLSITRQQIVDYAQAQHLSWVDDESNDNTDFDRNYLRRHVMPLLQTRWPAATQTICRATLHCAEAESLNQQLAQIDYAVVAMNGSDPKNEENMFVSDVKPRQVYLSLPQLVTLPESRQRNVIRYWLQQHQLPLPSAVKMQQILQTIIHSRYDAVPVVDWPHAEVRRFRHNLYAMSPLVPHDPHWRCEWDAQVDLVLPANIGVLKASDYRDLAAGKSLTIQFRQGGETIVLPGRVGHHAVKKLMQEWGIPPWLRNRIPLVYCDEQLVQIAREI
jgi:tRNA(Ile)-lysidine synthase